jgi:hypothetical protein
MLAGCEIESPGIVTQVEVHRVRPRECGGDVQPKRIGLSLVLYLEFRDSILCVSYVAMLAALAFVILSLGGGCPVPTSAQG